MANSNDNAIVRVERDGVEYFTVKATGESGLSESGLSVLSQIPRRTLGGWLRNLGENKLAKGLESLLGKDLYLGENAVKRGGQVRIVKAEYCLEILEFAAFERKSAIARQTLKATGTIGLTSYIQSQTGWLPEKYTAVPAAHKQLNRILDAPNPWVKLYDPDFCRQVYKWYGPQFYWIFCYCFLTPVERCKLDQINPAIKGDRKHRIHQYLEEDTKQRLAPHVWQLIAIVNTAGEDKQVFSTGYQKHFGDGLQLQLKLDLF